MNSAIGRVVDKLRRGVYRAEESLLQVHAFERLRLSPSAALTVTSDDGSIRNLEVADALAAADVQGVFAVSPALLGQPGMLRIDDVRRLRDAGHEIAFHGVDDTPFHRYTNATLAERCRTGLRLLDAEGVRASVVMFPHGMHNRRIRRSVASVFSAGFSTSFGINSGEINRFAIRRVPFGAYADPGRFDEAFYHSLVRDAAARGNWLVLMLHPGADPQAAANHDRLVRVLRTARECAVALRTATDHLLRQPQDAPSAARVAPAAGK